MKKNIIGIVITVLLLMQYHSCVIYGEKEVKVLYINSYHEGYKWSDDIKSAIEGELVATNKAFNLQIEYLDTLNHNILDLDEYFDKIQEVFIVKYAQKPLDVIITSDDAAYQFVRQYGQELWPEVPVIFCGLNDFDEQEIKSAKMPMTGIVEEISVREQLKLIQQIHPDIERIHYIVDETITGKNIENNILEQVQAIQSQVEFVKVPNATLEDVEKYVAQLSDHDIVLLTIYYYEQNGKYYEYDEAVKDISKASTVPVYGMWDFHLGNGIVGGSLLNGYEQGRMTIEILREYLNGTNIENIEVISAKSAAKTKFDFIQMIKNKIKLEALPADADIVNYVKKEVPNVLVIHSYSQGFKWTENINQGINDAFEFGYKDVKPFIEYLDLKRVSNPVYLKQQKEIIENKYMNKPIDLIITSDDGALEFVTKYLEINTENAAIVFCGINYFDENLLEQNSNITGVVESYDMAGTIKLMGQIQPDLKKVIVINDTTLTGQANHKNLEKVIQKYKSNYEFVFWEEMNMSDLQKKVSELDNESGILLLSFNRDKSNNTYTYDESISLIREYAAVPIYGVWDFYMDKGIVGGVITSGYSQGKVAGDMAVQILNGVEASQIRVIQEKTNKPMIDKKIFKEFSYLRKEFPEGTMVINQGHWLSLYRTNKVLFNLIIALFFVGATVIILLVLLLRSVVISKRKIRTLAIKDDLTGVFNRGMGINLLEETLRTNIDKKQHTVISFIDVNNLKCVNDTYGHKEGDFLIKNCVQVIEKYLTQEDVLCRMGGDEFMIIYEERSVEKAQEKIAIIDYHLIRLKELLGKEYEFSISTGFAVSPWNDPIDSDVLIEDADKDMYQNKKAYKQEQMEKHNNSSVDS